MCLCFGVSMVCLLVWERMHMCTFLYLCVYFQACVKVQKKYFELA